ncbi:hypothetical protein GCM10025854_08130 [Tetragenococcus muriaticus]|nr:hypothetical protein GCM10025854_08130 [Tetragenococcus muriaticus]
MSEKQLSKKYNPQEVESGRYQKWLEQDLFKPSGNKEASPYSVVIPLPMLLGNYIWDTHGIRPYKI